MEPARIEPRRTSMLGSPWVVAAVLAAAVISRFLMVTHWSLWLDEETSIRFAQNPAMGFPSHFPVFFVLLGQIFEFTGVSVTAGRLFVATTGALNIVLVYVVVARLVSREVAVVAASVLVLSLGHLSWSQSIRYYILLLTFQVAAVYFFVHGFERGRWFELMLSNVFLFLSLLTHLSAALLFPVLLAHLGLSMLLREKGGGYTPKGYAAFGIPFLLVTVFTCYQYMTFQESSSLASLVSGPTVSGGSPGRFAPLLPYRHIFQLVPYFGVPFVALSLGAPFVDRGILSSRILRFFVCLAFLPVMALLVAGMFRVFPLWYHALISLVGVGVLAGVMLVSLQRRGHLRAYRVCSAVAFGLSLLLLVSYYTIAHGDRPRWREAVRFVQMQASLVPGATSGVRIFGQKQVVAFYLEGKVSPTWSHPLVRSWPSEWEPERAPIEPEWYLVLRQNLLEDQSRWLSQHCELMADFRAWTGPRDRTIAVYRRRVT
jgi:hypothetical protein